MNKKTLILVGLVIILLTGGYSYYSTSKQLKPLVEQQSQKAFVDNIKQFNK